MTVQEIKQELDGLNVPYKPTDNKAKLQSKLTRAQNKVAKEADVVELKDNEAAEFAVNDDGTIEDVEVVEKPVAPAKALPVYRGVKVTKVLGKGHTASSYHCEGYDCGTKITLHVPRDLID